MRMPGNAASGHWSKVTSPAGVRHGHVPQIDKGRCDAITIVAGLLRGRGAAIHGVHEQC